MNNIHDFSTSVVSDIKTEDGKYQFDLGLIVIVGSILINVIQLLLKYNVFGRKTEDRIRHLGPIEKLILSRVIRNKLPKEYLPLKEDIKNNILANIEKLSSQDLNKIITEVKNAR